MANKAKLMKMLESLMNDDGSSADQAIHEYTTEKFREMLGESCGMSHENEEDDMKDDKKDEGKKDDKGKKDKKDDKVCKDCGKDPCVCKDKKDKKKD